MNVLNAVWAIFTNNGMYSNFETIIIIILSIITTIIILGYIAKKTNLSERDKEENGDEKDFDDMASCEWSRMSKWDKIWLWVFIASIIVFGAPVYELMFGINLSSPVIMPIAAVTAVVSGLLSGAIFVILKSFLFSGMIFVILESLLKK